MYDLLSFDEVNELSSTQKAIPYTTYFGEMALTKTQIKERIALAEDLEECFIFCFAFMLVLVQYGSLQRETAIELMKSRYAEAITGHVANVDDQYIQEHIEEVSESIVGTTFDNMDDPYSFSKDRAKFDAENESNAIFDYEDFVDAKTSGKTRKKWITLKDEAVRATHRKVDERVIPIDDLFVVGNTFMRFPKDTKYASGHPEEIIGCRCIAKYF